MLTTNPQVKNVLKLLWRDERGILLSAEFVLLATLLAIGMVAGIATLRDAVVCELADSAAAISAWDVGYACNNVCVGNGCLPANANLSGQGFGGSFSGGPAQIATASQVFGQLSGR